MKEPSYKTPWDEDHIPMIEWIKLPLQPATGHLVMVTGDSGYSTHTKFLTLARLVRPWKPSEGVPIRWVDVTGTNLDECGWTPTHWAEVIDLPDEDPD